MTTMLQGGDFAAVPELGYEEWRAVVRSTVGRYNPVGDPNGRKGVMTYLLQKIFSSKVLPERSKAGTACCSSSVMVGSKLAST
jgi:hypothetical protein